jgi:hypothetical protein
MGVEMVSSVVLSNELGVEHKQIKKMILEKNIRVVPGGLQVIDNSNQRVVIVDKNLFYNKLSSGSRTLRRGKKKPS